MMAVYIAVGVLLLLVVLLYNSLIGKKNNLANTFSAIDVQLKQRYDLIPNLVATVKTYMQHERGTLEEVTKLRAQAMTGGLGMAERSQIENKITRSLGNIIVAAENYPQLKADSSFVNLQKSLNEVEAQIAAARRGYNTAVTEYNNAIEMFPTNICARILGYKVAEVLVAEEVERKNVNVAQMFNS